MWMHNGPWALHYDRGLGSLARHRPAEAVKSLQTALEECPPSKSQDLYKICLYLGVALQRVGFPQSAIKSWISCQRLNKRGPDAQDAVALHQLLRHGAAGFVGGG